MQMLHPTNDPVCSCFPIVASARSCSPYARTQPASITVPVIHALAKGAFPPAHRSFPRVHTPRPLVPPRAHTHTHTHTHLASTCAPPASSQARVPARSPAVTCAYTIPSSHARALPLARFPCANPICKLTRALKQHTSQVPTTARQTHSRTPSLAYDL
ncbi:hypothetical protein FIBSPDRAFT_73799 [Athelia psychrophila]|uniref:Uncharacterized protein n=1 Tax=Athelia psychrophila TaxID=1759441 RepID=A0A166EN90_9AGAM|nr:hypothetical protein FIBSPDRAFT_73799 [Fibularhizoctonia sp. CBS 109695]